MPRRSQFGVKGLFQKRGWFYYRAEGKSVPGEEAVAGRMKAVALKTQDLATAVALAAELRDEVMIHRAGMAGTMTEAVEVFMATKSRLEEGTQRYFRGVLDGFVSIVGNIQVSRLTAEVMKRWVDHLLQYGGRAVEGRKDGKGAKGLARGTVTSYLLAMRVFVRWAMREGYFRADPLVDFLRDMRVTETKVQRFVTVEERERVLAVPMDDDLRWMVLLGFFQGFRHAEMLAMKKEWVWLSPDGTRGTVTVQATRVRTAAGEEILWQPKTKKKRTLPLHAEVLRFIQEKGMREPFVVAPWRDAWPDKGSKAYRYDPKKGLRKVGDAAGVKGLTYHMMRRSFATHLAIMGVEMVQIAELIGDSLRVTEQHYIAFAPRRNPLEGL